MCRTTEAPNTTGCSLADLMILVRLCNSSFSRVCLLAYHTARVRRAFSAADKSSRCRPLSLSGCDREGRCTDSRDVNVRGFRVLLQWRATLGRVHGKTSMRRENMDLQEELCVLFRGNGTLQRLACLPNHLRMRYLRFSQRCWSSGFATPRVPSSGLA